MLSFINNNLKKQEKQLIVLSVVESLANSQPHFSSQTLLEKLYFDANQYMLRKAYANVLLKWRDHQLPTLAELSCQ